MIGGRREERSAWNGRRGSGSSRRRRSCPTRWRATRTGASGGAGGVLSQNGPPSPLEIGGRTGESGSPSERSPSQALQELRKL